MIYAQILNNTVVSAIVLNNPFLIPLFSKGYQYFIEIDQLPNPPSLGWTYDGINFSAPPPTPVAQPILAVLPPIVQVSDVVPVLQNIVNSTLNQDPSYVQVYAPAQVQQQVQGKLA